MFLKSENSPEMIKVKILMNLQECLCGQINFNGVKRKIKLKKEREIKIKAEKSYF